MTAPTCPPHRIDARKVYRAPWTGGHGRALFGDCLRCDATVRVEFVGPGRVQVCEDPKRNGAGQSPVVHTPDHSTPSAERPNENRPRV